MLRLFRSEPADNPATDRILKTLGESARPDLARLRRGVERGLLTTRTEESARPRLGLRWVWGTAVACCLAAVVLWGPWKSSHPAIVLLTVGDEISTEQGPIAQLAKLRYGSTIQSGQGSMAALLLSDLSSLRMNESTSLRLDNRRDINLIAGKIFAEVSKTTGGKDSFRVKAGDVTVTVLGTRFEVASSGSEVNVSVEEGRVKVESGGSAVELGTGETVQVRNGTLGARARVDRLKIAEWRIPLSDAEKSNPVFIDLMRQNFPSRSLDSYKDNP
ncbi:MAG TPA: FecR family protein [bacterium]|nr:FecR family protein [bacterium]